MSNEHNIYQKPESEVEDPKFHQTGKADQFYIVSPVKFWVLFVATLGLYSVYWFYKNWQEYKLSNDLNIWPIPRAIFNIFFIHSLYRNIQANADVHNSSTAVATSTTATLYIIFSILSNVSDRFLVNLVGLELATLSSIVFMMISGYALYKGQVAINLVSGDPQGRSNSSFGVVNILWILLGAGLWSMFIIGLFFVSA